MKILILVIIIAIVIILILLPKILNVIGLHPTHKSKSFNLSGKKALIITTSQRTLGKDGKPTGVYASEMTVPYYKFIDSNMIVDMGSINGGEIPIEKISLKYPIATPEDKRFLNDNQALYKVKNSIKIDDLDFLEYDIIFLAGGWGAAYDLGQSEVLGEKMTEANKAKKVIGGVCHGPLGLIKAKKENGEPLLKDRIVTAVTNKQIKELKVQDTPLHPETEIRKLGAYFKSKTRFQDLFANLVVSDRNIVTGQNQNAGAEVAEKMMELITTKKF